MDADQSIKRLRDYFRDTYERPLGYISQDTRTDLLWALRDVIVSGGLEKRMKTTVNELLNMETGLVCNLKAVELFTPLMGERAESWLESRKLFDPELLTYLVGEPCPYTDLLLAWTRLPSTPSLTRQDIEVIVRAQGFASILSEAYITELVEDISTALELVDGPAQHINPDILDVIHSLLGWTPNYSQSFFEILSCSSWGDETAQELQNELQTSPYLDEAIYYSLIESKDEARSMRVHVNALRAALSIQIQGFAL